MGRSGFVKGLAMIFKDVNIFHYFYTRYIFIHKSLYILYYFIMSKFIKAISFNGIYIFPIFHKITVEYS